MSTPFAAVASRAARLSPELRDELSTPALLVDLDAVRRNLERIVSLCGGDPARWRPHLKTTKSPAVWSLLLEAGVRRFKVATARELEVLVGLLVEREVAADVLVAQGATPPLARAAAAAASALGPSGAQVSILVEDERQLDWIPAPVSVFVDVNPGGHRTGIELEHSARAVGLARAAGARLRGIHSYEGHLHGPFPERGAAIDLVFAGLRRLLAELDAAGVAVGEVATSGTPAFHHVLRTEPLAGAPGAPRHTVCPGTVLFHDLRSELENPELGLEPAALVLARVVSRPRRGRVTVDAGSKAIAAEAGDPIAVALGRPELVGAPPNEEHLPLDGPVHGALPELGELVELVPRHVCPTVNLHERALVLDGRGLGSIAIAARGHHPALVAPVEQR